VLLLLDMWLPFCGREEVHGNRRRGWRNARYGWLLRNGSARFWVFRSCSHDGGCGVWSCRIRQTTGALVLTRKTDLLYPSRNEVQLP
jgi:hypothetical protein